MKNNQSNQALIEELVEAINNALADHRYGEAAKYMDILAFIM